MIAPPPKDKVGQAAAAGAILKLMAQLPALHTAPAELARFLEAANNLSSAVAGGAQGPAPVVSEGMNQVLQHLVSSCISTDWRLAPKIPSRSMLVAGGEACGLGCDIARHTYDRMAAEISSAGKIDVAPLVNFIASVAAANRALAGVPDEDPVDAQRPM